MSGTSLLLIQASHARAAQEASKISWGSVCSQSLRILPCSFIAEISRGADRGHDDRGAPEPAEWAEGTDGEEH